MDLASPAMALGRPGAFPRSELQADEKVIFEGKPSLVAMCFLGILWLVLCLGGGLLLAALTIIVWQCSLTSVALATILGISPFIYLYVQWSGTSFALTDRRVLLRRTGSSLRSLTRSLPIGQVTQTYRSRSFTDGLVGAGNIGFSAAAGVPGLAWPSVAEYDTLGPFIDDQLDRLKVAPPESAAPTPPTAGGFVMAPVIEPAVLTPPPGQVRLPLPPRRCPSCGMNFGGEGSLCPFCGAKA
jgi:hypothetical protein